MPDFPFPLASIIHECAVDNKRLYFTTHEIIRKNLKAMNFMWLRDWAKLLLQLKTKITVSSVAVNSHALSISAKTLNTYYDPSDSVDKIPFALPFNRNLSLWPLYQLHSFCFTYIIISKSVQQSINSLLYSFKFTRHFQSSSVYTRLCKHKKEKSFLFLL